MMNLMSSKHVSRISFADAPVQETHLAYLSVDFSSLCSRDSNETRYKFKHGGRTNTTIRESHSYGEYVFDHVWANAYSRYGGSYYPKLQCCVPFTPATGPRILAREGPVRDQVFDGLCKAINNLKFNFDEFLMDLKQSKRKNIRQERKKVDKYEGS